MHRRPVYFPNAIQKAHFVPRISPEVMFCQIDDPFCTQQQPRSTVLYPKRFRKIYLYQKVAQKSRFISKSGPESVPCTSKWSRRYVLYRKPVRKGRFVSKLGIKHPFSAQKRLMTTLELRILLPRKFS